MMALKTVFHTGPVTALCFHDCAILAGIGSRLYIYSTDDASSKQVVEVLHGRNLHGIRNESRSGRTRMCVFGQKCIRIVECDPQSFQLKILTDIIEFADWIWDIVWLKDIPAISLALGHNVVVTFDIDRQVLIENSHCEEKCILYCAKFITHRQDSLVVAAGTVFNQVVIWSPVGDMNENGRKNVIHRLTGHQGVIFSVDYNPESQRICSVSDDRSIRLYQVKFHRPVTALSIQDWQNMDTSLLHVLYGHSARVWDVRLLSSVFVSVGEDSTCIVWSYEGHVIQRLKGHKGKSIWSMSVDRGENFVVTGGGDNSIRLWNLEQQGTGADKQKLAISIPLEVPDEDFPRNTLLLDTDRVLILTNMGYLLLYHHLTKRTTTLMADVKFASYTVMAVSPQSRSIAIGNIAGTLRIFTSSDAVWEDVSQVTTTDVSLYQGKLFSVLWLDERSLLTTGPEGAVKISQVDQHGNTVEVKVIHDLDLPPSKHRWVSAAAFVQDGSHIVCGDRMGSVYLYCLDGECKQSKPVQIFPKLHGKTGVTSVMCHGDYVYTTGRDGLYRVYSWTEQENLDILNSNRVFKGLEWVEKISFEEDEDLKVQGFHANLFVVWSVQRNQKLLEIECGGGHRAWGFCCHGNKAQFVFIKSREVLLKEIDIMPNQTILKGSLHGRELCDAKHACTGLDRAGSNCEVLVTCSEDTNICISVLQYINDIPTLKVLNTLGSHISSVRCLSVCPSCEISQNASYHRKLIFSGGGRAQLIVSRIAVKFPTNLIENAVRTGKEHLNTCVTQSASGNSCEAFQENAEESFSRAKEEAVVKHIEQSAKHIQSKISEQTSQDHSSKDKVQYNPQDNVISVDSDVQCSPEHLATVQLGQSGKRRKKPWRHFEEYSDPETRILDMTVISGREIAGHVPESLFYLTLACSDGYVRFFAFDEQTREIVQLFSSSYHNHCVLKTCHVICESDTETNNKPNLETETDVLSPNEDCSGVEESETFKRGHSSSGNTLETKTDSHVTAYNDDVAKFDDHVIPSGSHVTSCSDDVTPLRGHVIVLTAATDGLVAFWDMTELCKSFVSDIQQTNLQAGNAKQCQGKMDNIEEPRGTKQTEMVPIFTLRLHQSGINSVYFSQQSDGRYMLLTGGDDNAVKVTMVTMETTKGHVMIKVMSQGGHQSAHAAQITGVWTLSPSTILTASIDQRVCIWNLTENDEEIKLSLLDCMFVDVMDIANIDVWSEGSKTYVLLSGEGLQVLEVDLGSRSRPVFRSSQAAKLVK